MRGPLFEIFEAGDLEIFESKGPAESVPFFGILLGRLDPLGYFGLLFLEIASRRD